jgi:alpha/beta superfamily hydrolase
MMKHIVKTVAIIAPLLAFVGCGDGLHDPVNEEVKGGEIVVNFSSELMRKTLIGKKAEDDNISLAEASLFYPEDKVNGYKAYKIPYTTTDEKGEDVKASGLFVIPPMLHAKVLPFGGLSMVVDDHGTIFANREAPSVIGDRNTIPAGSSILLTSLGGFATLQPDYIGFGDSNDHYHPFILKKSLANATVDFIKQVKIFASDNNITLNNQLFLTGYSEGGYAAMATLKKIEDENLTDLKVTMAAPMAGPYALKPMSDMVLSSDTLGVPSFMADVGYAYAKAYNQDIETVINEPYASKLPALLNGDFNRTQIDPELTHETTGATGLFNSNFVTNYFADDDHWFKKAMIANNLYTWTPKTPVRLVHCKGDSVIPYVISELTAGTMNHLGDVNVSIVPVETVLGIGVELEHAECGLPAYKVTTGLFAKIRKETKGY